jgi:hypothetical protein
MKSCCAAQPPPTILEVEGCPEIIVRRCECGRELWWSVGEWKAL